MLSRLSLRGFKSFADQTSLELGPGVNVVVGPNGSGKSNLAEAVAWALGEQRAGRLRAGGMADVLYSGGPRRPAAPMAEVKLVLADDEVDGSAPAEVEAARRLTRAGDAHYRLNGASCRLLDVQEALSSRGIGPDALSVIRQGQVEALCTSTPAERRAIVDAAAGVAVAKRRRHRAELKLGRVADRLERARDIAGELRGRARALERQARAAERATALEDEVEAARRAVGAARARAAAQALERARGHAERLRSAAAADAEALARARASRASVSRDRAGAAEALAAAESLAAGLRTAAERLAGRAELAAERLAVADREARERAQRRLAASERLGAIVAAAAAAGEAADAAEAGFAQAEAAAAEADERDRQARAEHRLREDEAAAASGALSAAVRDRDEAERRADEARAGAAQLALLPDAPDPALLERAERREEVSAARAARWTELAGRADGAAADADAERAVAEQRSREARAAARALAPAAEEGDRSAAGLGEGLEVEPGMERAVAAALGALADAVPAGTLEEGRRTLAGGASWAAVPAPGRAPAVPAGARPLWSAVRACSDAARPHLERLLSDAWIVDRLDDVPAGAPGVAVTADGHALRAADGLLTRAEGGWARRALHRRAQEAEAAAAADLEATERAAQRAAAEVAAVARRRRAAERAAARAAERLATARADAAAHAVRTSQAAGERELLVAEAAGRDAALQAAGERHERALSEARVAVEVASAARLVAEEAASALRSASAQAVDARAALAAARAERAEADARAAATAAVAQEPAAEADLQPARSAAEALSEVARALAPAADRAREEVSAVLERARAVEAELLSADRRVEEAELAAAASAQTVHEAEVDAAVAAERAAEAGPPPEPGEQLPDPDEAAVLLADLERRREALGAVNPLAAAEREELGEREVEMLAQMEDLEAAAAALRSHLGELDAAVTEGFEAIFSAFQERFTEVCGQLFPGGEGRLRAVADEDGEAGIEVEVVPAGKRPRSLTLMSGGERSLVALAFCLALAMARPAPFYVLDEVEAALDDVNLRRFLTVVRGLAETQQFLLITHQQPTVEIADTLFGVTMGSEGVSQIIARRLRRDVEGPARPYVRRALRAIPGGRPG